MKRTSIAAVLCVAGTIRAFAQAAPEPAAVTNLPSRYLATEKELWTAPFRKSSYSSHAVKKYVVPFTLISLALIATDKKTANVLPNTPDQSRWSGRVSQIGAWYSMAGIGAATYLGGQFAGDSHAKEAGLLSLEALGHTQLAVFALKQVTNRERPTEHDGRGGFWEGGTSFPSGHSASAFAMATVFAYEYREHLAVPITSYALASVVSLSRAGARRHWASDIFVGGSMGFMIGRFTYRRNHNPNLPGVKVSLSDRLMPKVGMGRSGPALSWEF